MAKKHASMGAVGKSLRPRSQISQQHHSLRELVKVLGFATDTAGKRLGVALRLRGSGSPPLICPTSLTGRYNAAGLERWILNNGLDAVLSQLKVTEFGIALRELAGTKTVVVVDEPGFHRFETHAQSFAGMVWNGQIYYFGATPPIDVLLVDAALARNSTAGTLDGWLTCFEKIAQGNPRLIVILCIALGAAIRRALREDSFTAALIAGTSTGKSTAQAIVSSMTGRPTVLTWNATNVGMQDWLAGLPDQPACVEDLHKADKPDDVSQILMNVGNSGGRVRSKRTEGSGRSKSIQTTLLVSSERSIASIAAGAPAGLLARCFEIHAGAQGMFDSLCGFDDGGQLADALKRDAHDNFGAVWPEWLRLLSKAWKQVHTWHSKHLATVRVSIIKQAGDPKLDELTGRLANRLAFGAFSGIAAQKLGLWSLDRESILAAFALVLKEHIERSPAGRNALAQAAVASVRAYVETHRASFPALATANDPNVRSGISGYVAEDRKLGTLYLFIPAVFQRLFEEFGEDIYAALKAQGLLATQARRHNQFLKRIPRGVGGEARRMLFIAVRDEIRYAGSRS